MRQKRWIGGWMLGIGVIHSLFGFYFMGDTLAVLWREGLFNTVNGQPEREFAFWFIYFGLLALVLGGLVDWCEKRQVGLPRFLGWALLGLTAICGVVMPISGVWLLLPPAIGSIARSRSA